MVWGRPSPILAVSPHHTASRSSLTPGGYASTHLLAGQPIAACPMQEHALRDVITVQFFLRNKCVRQSGFIPLPTAPGLDAELDDDVIESREELRFGA